MNRRHFISTAAAALVVGAYGAAATAPTGAQAATPAPATRVAAGKASPAVILVLGDSLSAEYGLRRGTGWVALLEKKLGAEVISARVVNASISGDTTSGGHSRLAALLTQHRPSHVVIELGGNDALRGLPLQMTEDNLNAMAVAAKKAGAKVLLVGMQVPPNYGTDYANKFAGLFDKVARANKTGLVPFLLTGVADGPDPRKLFQNDGIHPREEAHPAILANVWAELRKQLQ